MENRQLSVNYFNILFTTMKSWITRYKVDMLSRAKFIFRKIARKNEKYIVIFKNLVKHNDTEFSKLIKTQCSRLDLHAELACFKAKLIAFKYTKEHFNEQKNILKLVNSEIEGEVLRAEISMKARVEAQSREILNRVDFLTKKTRNKLDRQLAEYDVVDYHCKKKNLLTQITKSHNDISCVTMDNEKVVKNSNGSLTHEEKYNLFRDGLTISLGRWTEIVDSMEETMFSLETRVFERTKLVHMFQNNKFKEFISWVHSMKSFPVFASSEVDDLIYAIDKIISKHLSNNIDTNSFSK